MQKAAHAHVWPGVRLQSRQASHLERRQPASRPTLCMVCTLRSARHTTELHLKPLPNPTCREEG